MCAYHGYNKISVQCRAEKKNQCLVCSFLTQLFTPHPPSYYFSPPTHDRMSLLPTEVLTPI